jgi:NAD(P)H-flavin reductase
MNTESVFVARPVVDAWDETLSLRAVAVELGDLGAAHRVAGQVVRVRVPGGTGHFALANAPANGRGELLIRRGAPVADELIAEARPGSALELTAPFGQGFPVEAAVGRDLLLFAAGSGIAPIRAVVQEVLARRPEFGHVALFYGERGADSFAFSDEHADWRADNVHVILCSSDPAGGWEGARGYVQDVARSHELAAVHPERTVAFLCGMKPMVIAVRAMLSENGLATERTYLNF